MSAGQMWAEEMSLMEKRFRSPNGHVDLLKMSNTIHPESWKPYVDLARRWRAALREQRAREAKK